MSTGLGCIHDARSRDTGGFYCRDCKEYFRKDSPVYRSGELLGSLWMVLHNINVDLRRAGKHEDPSVSAIQDKIGIGVRHNNYEELIAEAEAIMGGFGKDADSATLVLG